MVGVVRVVGTRGVARHIRAPTRLPHSTCQRAGSASRRRDQAETDPRGSLSAVQAIESSPTAVISSTVFFRVRRSFDLEPFRHSYMPCL
jgi:hypothetical protein